MSKKDLLQDAIADAKLVKQTAIENAKQLIAESFQNQVQSIISKKLSEEDDEYEDEEEIMDVENNAMADDETELNDMEDEVGDGEDIAPEEDSQEEIADEGDEDASEVDSELEEILRELEDESSDEEEPDISGEDESLSDEDLEEIVRALSEMEDEIDSEDEIEVSEEDDGYDNNVSESEKDLAEAYKTIKYLRNQLNEVNLLNTQLLFTNKLFGKFNLTNEQKERVINLFDKVGTLKEAKLVYATLLESFAQGKVSRKSRLKESFASNNVGISTKPKNIVNENFVNRMQQLANIKK